MAVLNLKSFGGIAPIVPPRYLEETQAQTALNCPVFQGSIQSLSDLGSSVATLDKSGTIQSIYRFGQDTLSDSQHWFHWTTDVDVARSQIAGDTSEWTFFTGDGIPKATYAAIGTSGGTMPTVSRPLGLPAPTTAVTATANSFSNTNETKETRVYAMTFVNKESGFEFESAPSPASNSVDVFTGQTVALTNFPAVPGGDYIVSHRRIYRAVAGVFLFVAEVTVATSSFTDNVAADFLGEELPSLFYTPPPAGLKGLINLPNGILAVFNGRDVFFSDPYKPYAWPESYIQTLDFPVVGLGRMDTTLVVLTKGTPYFIQGTHPSNMAVVKSDLEQACVSKRSIVSLMGGVLYAAPDGLMFLSGGGSRIVTENLFDFSQWQTLFAPASIHAYQQDNQYIGFYNNGSTSGGFIFDVRSGQFILHDIYANAGYHDLLADKLYVAVVDSGNKIKIFGDGSSKTYTWKSKKFTMPQIMGFSCAQLEAEAYPMTLKVYADGALVHTQTVQNRDPFRLPSKVGRDWEMQIEGSNEVFALSVANSMSELAGV